MQVDFSMSVPALAWSTVIGTVNCCSGVFTSTFPGVAWIDFGTRLSNYSRHQWPCSVVGMFPIDSTAASVIQTLCCCLHRTVKSGTMKAQGLRHGVIFSVIAVLLIFAGHCETASRTKRRRCMAVKNEWRSMGFGDNQQVPSSPVSGEHISVVIV